MGGRVFVSYSQWAIVTYKCNSMTEHHAILAFQLVVPLVGCLLLSLSKIHLPSAPLTDRSPPMAIFDTNLFASCCFVSESHASTHPAIARLRKLRREPLSVLHRSQNAIGKCKTCSWTTGDSPTNPTNTTICSTPSMEGQYYGSFVTRCQTSMAPSIQASTTPSSRRSMRTS